MNGPDGAGGNWHFDGLKPGQYTVHLVYECREDSLKFVLARPTKHVIDPKEAPFWMGKVTTASLAVELAAPPVQGAPLGEVKKVGTLKSMKGWELYIWQEDGQTLYSLLVGTNRNKTDDEITKAAVKGVEDIKPKLAALNAGEYITICGHKHADHPPKTAADELAEYCKKVDLKAHSIGEE